MRSMAVALVGLSWVSVLQAEPLPSYLNSNETERNLPAPNLPADAFRPTTPKLQVPSPATAQPQPLMMNTKVLIHKIRIEGGTVYPLSELRENYQGLLDREVTVGELIEATRRLTQRYQQDGYLLSYAFLPVQDFAEGRLRVVLVEGYISDYELQGDVGRVSGYLDKLVTKLKAVRPLTRKAFERYTSLMSRVPGITLQASVPPPGTTDGASKLMVQASRKPFTTTMNLTDGSRDDIQALFGANSNAHTAVAEQLSISALFPPGEDKEHYFRADYSQSLDSEGTQLILSASRYRSDPSAVVRLTDNINLKQHRENDRYSIGLTHPLIASPNEWLSLSARFYAVDDTTDYRVIGFPLKVSTNTDIRALAFEGDWRKATEKQLRIISAGVYQGLDHFGANTNAGYDLDFFRLRLSGVQSDRFFDNWQGVASAALYWTDDSLPDSERAVFGGQNFGRGYPVDQASGDKGWGAAYEVNYSFKRDGEWVKMLQPYVVLDAARTWFNELQVQDSRMSSLALGLRFGDAHYYNISLEAAKPMSDMALDSFNRRPRFTVSFSYQL
ncbi:MULTISPECIES: ShlB/FhaC/HecB family hemolysin secretion/activation protein [unclassified Pseudomonas]|uniref:ShlB/FhaC/HecB family hemolysin secretion/activation protein n=1 Tax=unclassified Pseudomonas TaxID=196821 RepID=UPI0021C8A249|nr:MULTISPECIES: POTRA domain-containing protein [unclassified Pseudomonas]MCU1735695.1 ShlB/FhaC/HecB family hemolysin secretion/activation protein [Pseudomonas sp. 20P_3.2_Bac4]MCU1744252.1 ShlB/FhaC/HecB family hemolysin secretion/activation protein [Pseudomonas sp. 20P_3.2_Bac5]